MLETLVVILVLVWALGYFGGFAAGGLVHLLLVIALVVFILRVVTGKRLS